MGYSKNNCMLMFKIFRGPVDKKDAISCEALIEREYNNDNILLSVGSLTRDFRHQIFFINQCPPGP
jgi:hypothetical protein